MPHHARPVFVTGFPRSGTTLLQRLIGSHPNIAAAPEIHFFSRIHDFTELWGDLSVDANLRRVVRELCRPPAMLSSPIFDEDAVFSHVAGTARTYRDLLAGLMAVAAEQAGKPRWSEKTPAQEAGRIWALFPEAQVVHIVRDVRDVICSVRAAPWVHPTARTADIAVEWARFTLATIQSGTERGPEQYLTVRYEDVARAPEPVMRTVFAFLGEDFSGIALDPTDQSLVPEAAWWMHRALEPIRAAPQMQWARELSRSDQALAWAAARNVLVGLGYPPQRRRTAIAGALLLGPTGVRRRWTRWKLEGRTRTPEARYAHFTSYVDRQLRRAGMAGVSDPRG